ncbi:MAG: ATP-binding protein, partial [Verrucomicrobia bacterium]|nr:ATP-binding protein [Verrucomicrobiota bacterium]
LPDGRIAANTRQNGLLLVSADGQSYLQLDRPRGLGDNTTFGLALDSGHGLWVAGMNGLARVSIDPTLSTFDERNGPSPGSLRGFARQGPVLYASVLSSLQRLAPADYAIGAPAHFVPVPDAPRAMTDIASHVDGLLFTSFGTLHQLGADGTFRKLYTRDEDFYLVSAPEKFPERVVIGTERRCIIGELHGTKFTVRYETTDTGPIEVVRHLDDGSILLGTRGRGFWRFYPGTDGWANPRIDVIGEKEGLPPTRSWTAPFRTPLGLRFHTADGTWRFDEATHRFQRDPAFAEDGRDRYAYVGSTDAQNRHWASGGFIKNPFDRRVGWFDFTDPAHARWHDAPATIQGLVGNLGPSFLVIDPAVTTRTMLWAKSPNTILRFDGDALAAAPATPWRPSLRRVFANGRRHPLAAPGPRFDYSTEPIVFDFSSDQLDGTPVTFQTRLVGFDDRWADAPSPTLALTNLSGGPFTLEFRARDLTGRLSETGRFVFAVAPPWYRSAGAFALYALAALGGVAGYVRWRLGRAAREQRPLEAIVAERTRDLATARDQAESASRAKSAFLAAMSHELRTPLNGVIGYAQVLQDDRRLLADQRERLRIVQNSGEHLLRMINDVLDLAKIEAGKLELRPAPFALGDLIRDIAAAHAPAAAAKHLTFAIDLAPDLPGWVEGDAQKLRQVLDNLLGNAVKFTATGSVTLRVRPSPVPPTESQGALLHAQANGQLLQFSVIDTGPGIDAADQARLFHPFEQAERSRPNAPGAGLGLAISRALVERFGGSLALDSEPGRGSTFGFTAPFAVLAAAPALVPRGVRLAGFQGPPRHVLIVDDHAVNRSLLIDLLVPLGFSCAEFPSGEAALAHLHSPGLAWPDLAILDVRMEGLDGLELTRRLRALPRGGKMKILLTSASVLTFDPAEGRRAGCDDFLPKPFRTADLVEKIGALLSLRWRDANSAPPFPVPAVPLPPAVRNQLREFLAQGDLEAFRAALSAARPAHPAAIARFTELESAAAAFELSRLRQLLEQP